jgi:hypothetical protein
MRTITLLCAAVIWAGCSTAPADNDAKKGKKDGNDMPVEVADSGGLPGAAATKGVSTRITHQPAIQAPSGPHLTYYVQDANYQAVCLCAGADPPVALGKSWSARFYDKKGYGFTLMSGDDNEIDFVNFIPDSPYPDHLDLNDYNFSHILVTVYDGTAQTTTTLPSKPTMAPLDVMIHYCEGGKCGPKDPCK